MSLYKRNYPLNFLSQHKKFIFVDQSLMPGVFNLIINGLICWLLFRSIDTLSLWGEHSFGPDLLITALLLPALTCAIVSPLIARQVASGKVLPLDRSYLDENGVGSKPLIVRVVIIGIAGVVFAGFPFVGLLNVIQPQAEAVTMASTHYIVFKAIWAALTAMIVSPVIAWWALQSSSIKLA